MLFEEKYLLIEAICPQFRTTQKDQEKWNYKNFRIDYDWANKKWQVIVYKTKEEGYGANFFYDHCLKTALTKANYQDWGVEMCPLEKEVDRLNCKFGLDFESCKGQEWYGEWDDVFLYRKDNKWFLYGQMSQITTSHTSLEEAWEWYELEADLVHHTETVERLVKHPSLLEAWKQWKSNPNCREALNSYNSESVRVSFA